MTDPLPPVVCTISSKDITGQVLEWQELQHRAAAVGRIEGGATMTLPAALTDSIKALAAREMSCCAFLTIELTPVEDHVELAITSANPDGVAVARMIAGLVD